MNRVRVLISLTTTGIERRIGGKDVTVLKDDGCNKDVILNGFRPSNAQVLGVRKCNIPASHSKKNTTESETQFTFKEKVADIIR